jgi:hypothetical protein
LTFGHHALVTALAPHEQVEWLEKAVVGNWSISQMREAMKPKPPTLSSEIVVNKNFHQNYQGLFRAYNRGTPAEKQQMVVALRQLLSDMERRLE